MGELKQSMLKMVLVKIKLFSLALVRHLKRLKFAIKKQIKQINVESEEELEDVIKICKVLKKLLMLVSE